MRKVVSGILAVFMSMAIACGCLLLSNVLIPKNSQNSTTEIVDDQDKKEDNAVGNWLDYASATLAGDGTENSPFKISKPSDLALLAKMENEEVEAAATANSDYEPTANYYELTADLDMTAHEWTPIPVFTGNLDGNGHTIKYSTSHYGSRNFWLPEYNRSSGTSLSLHDNQWYIDTTSRAWTSKSPDNEKKEFPEYAHGLFANILSADVRINDSLRYTSGKIADLNVSGKITLDGEMPLAKDVNFPNTTEYSVHSAIYIGGVVGFAWDSSIDGVTSSVDVSIVGAKSEFGNVYVGGIVGVMETGNITNCIYSGTISFEIDNTPSENTWSKIYIGGIAAVLRSGFIKENNVIKEFVKKNSDRQNNEIHNCYFDGVIEYYDKHGENEAYYYQRPRYLTLSIGGILGYFCGTQIVGCASAGKIEVKGFSAIETSSFYVGGILGCYGIPDVTGNRSYLWFNNAKFYSSIEDLSLVYISECTNSSEITFGDMASRGYGLLTNARVGGILGGICRGTFFAHTVWLYVIGCSNFGSISRIYELSQSGSPSMIGGIMGGTCADEYNKVIFHIVGCLNTYNFSSLSGYRVYKNGKSEEIKARTMLGGIVGGALLEGIVESCINVGKISTCKDSMAGGIIGNMLVAKTDGWLFDPNRPERAYIVQCISPKAPVSIDGKGNYGALAGHLLYNDKSSIINNIVLEGEKPIQGGNDGVGVADGLTDKRCIISLLQGEDTYLKSWGYHSVKTRWGYDSTSAFERDDRSSFYVGRKDGQYGRFNPQIRSSWFVTSNDCELTKFALNICGYADLYVKRLIIPIGAVGCARISVEANDMNSTPQRTSVSRLQTSLNTVTDYQLETRVCFLKGRVSAFGNIKVGLPPELNITLLSTYYTYKGYRLSNDAYNTGDDIVASTDSKFSWVAGKGFYGGLGKLFPTCMPRSGYSYESAGSTVYYYNEEEVYVRLVFEPNKITRKITYDGPEGEDSSTTYNKYIYDGTITYDDKGDKINDTEIKEEATKISFKNIDMSKWYSVSCYFGEELQFELLPRAGYYITQAVSGLNNNYKEFDQNGMCEWLPILGDITIKFDYVKYSFRFTMIEQRKIWGNVGVVNLLDGAEDPSMEKKTGSGAYYHLDGNTAFLLENNNGAQQNVVRNISQDISISQLSNLKIEYGFKYYMYVNETEGVLANSQRFTEMVTPFIGTSAEIVHPDSGNSMPTPVQTYINVDSLSVNTKTLVYSSGVAGEKGELGYWDYKNESEQTLVLAVLRLALPFKITMHEMMNNYDDTSVYKENEINTSGGIMNGSVNDITERFFSVSNPYIGNYIAKMGGGAYYDKVYSFLSPSQQWKWEIFPGLEYQFTWDDSTANKLGYKARVGQLQDSSGGSQRYVQLTFDNILDEQGKIDSKKNKESIYLGLAEEGTKTLSLTDMLSRYAIYLNNSKKKDGDVFGEFFSSDAWRYNFDFYIYYDLQQYDLKITDDNNLVKIDLSKGDGVESEEKTGSGPYKVYYYQPVTLTADDAGSAKFAGMYRDGSNILTTSKVYSFANKPTEFTTKNAVTGKTSPMSSLSISIMYAKYYNTGTVPAKKNGVYQIDSADDLVWMSVHVEDGDTNGFANCLFKQTCDIDMSGKDFMPIGFGVPFRGSYDGGFYKISNLKLFGGDYQNNLSNMGLFGQTDGASIKNVVLINGETISGYGNVGTIVGSAVNSTFRNISNISVGVTLSETKHYDIYGREITKQDDDGDYKVRRNIAGFAGFAKNSSFVGCSNQGAVNVSGADNKVSAKEIISGTEANTVAALVGSATNTTVDQCFSENTIDAFVNGVEATNSYCNSKYFGQTDNSDIWVTLNEKKVLKIFYWLY